MCAWEYNYFAGAAGAVMNVTRCARATLFDEQSYDQPGSQHSCEPRPTGGIEERLDLRVPDAAPGGLEGDRQPQHRGELHARERATAHHPQAAHELGVDERQEEAEEQAE